MLLSRGTFSLRTPSIGALFRSHRRGSRGLTLTCRGKQIGEEDLYRYTNGRFLVNEEYQRRRRYVKFDILQLCAIASTVGDSKSSIVSIEKMEGGFCKALLMRKADDTEVIAKIPSNIAGAPKYSTASEVATLKYVKQHTKIPVPKVLAWDSDSSNSTGSEYIIMEKAPGVQLYKKWGDMDATARIALTRHLGTLEKGLTSLQFPASGNLYLKESMGSFDKWKGLPPDTDPSQSYCIGPSADRSWCVLPGAEPPTESFSAGPWFSLSEYGTSLAERESYRIRHLPQTRSQSYRHHGTDDEINYLNAAKEIMKLLETPPSRLASVSRPLLWHTDLHMGNIYVSEEDPTRIVSIIDWQSISVGPLFLQANWPEFLKPNDEYVRGMVRPQLPDDFEQLDEAEKKYALSTRDDALITKSYELRSAIDSPDVYRSRNLPSVFRETFIRCGEAAQEGTIGLCACLVALSESWSALRLAGQCPFSFTEEDILKSEQEYKEYKDWHDVQEFARSYLDTDADGWISPELDFTEVQQRNKTIFQRYVKDMSEYIPEDDARRRWPFLEGL